MSIKRTSWSAEAGFVFRWLSRIATSPILSLSVVGLIVAALSLASTSAQSAFLGSILLPWAALALILVSMPTMGAVIHRYRLSDQVRRNHALEHGTIYFLRKHYGKRYKLSGRSEERGFRVAGARTAADIQKAFAELLRHLKAGNEAVVVARGCGSNLVTAQACGLALMGILAAGLFVFSLSPLTVAIALASIIALVVVVRYPLGMWIQQRRFLLLDFSDASILSVHPVYRAEPFERHPVYFVRTQVYRRAQ